VFRGGQFGVIGASAGVPRVVAGGRVWHDFGGAMGAVMGGAKSAQRRGIWRTPPRRAREIRRYNQ